MFRALVAGWFSYSGRKATFGDTRAKDIVCQWLAEAGIPFDVAGNQENRIAGVDIYQINPEMYSFFIFVCGPWSPDNSILDRFKHCVKIGVNLSLSDEGRGGFDYLLPRDTKTIGNPDIVFSAKTSLVPVVGIVLVHPQPIYGDRQRHHVVQSVIDEFIGDGLFAPVWLDTILVGNGGKLSNINQFESIIRRTDFVITTRLHGMVLSLKNGIPVIVIDPVAGGAKITAQAKTLGWPLLINGEELSKRKLEKAVSRCLDGSLSLEVVNCGVQAEEKILQLKKDFLTFLKNEKRPL